jgi:hypothetical protein
MDNLSTTAFEHQIVTPKKHTAQTVKKVIPVWLPLKFPELPQKVRRTSIRVSWLTLNANR